MIDYFFLIPLALVIGGVALWAFMWSLKSGQYEDLDGAAERVLFDDALPPEQATPSTLKPQIIGRSSRKPSS